MGIQLVPGFEEQLGPALAQIIGATRDIVHPDYNFQQAMKIHLATHPELIGQLAKAEASAPGTLVKLGLGPLAQTVSRQPLSPQDQYELDNRNKIIQTLGETLNTTTAKTKLEGKKATDQQKVLDENPNIATQSATTALTGVTPWEQADGEQKLKMQKIASDIMSQGSAITLDKVKRNEYSPEQLAAIFASPLGPVLKFQLDQEQERIRIGLLNRQERNSEAQMNRLLTSQAMTMWQATHGAGTPHAFLQILSDPATLDRIKNIDPTNIPDKDRDLYAAFQGMENMNASDRAQQAANETKNIEAAIGAFNKVPNDKANEGEKATIAASLNRYLASRSLMSGGPQYSVSYEMQDLPFARDKKGLVFKDKAGNIVDPNVAIQGLPTTLMQSAPDVQKRANTLVNHYREMKNSKDPKKQNEADLSLASIKDKDPALYAAARDILDRNP